MKYLIILLFILAACDNSPCPTNYVMANKLQESFKDCMVTGQWSPKDCSLAARKLICSSLPTTPADNLTLKEKDATIDGVKKGNGVSRSDTM